MDEVNCNLAERMITVIAEEIQLECFAGRSSNARIDAWIYDLDQLPPDDRNLILRTLCRASPSRPVAVFSYSLPGTLRRRLRANGVLVRRRLDVNVFTELEARMTPSVSREKTAPLSGAI
jgi:hypothetical protein